MVSLRSAITYTQKLFRHFPCTVIEGYKNNPIARLSNNGQIQHKPKLWCHLIVVVLCILTIRSLFYFTSLEQHRMCAFFCFSSTKWHYFKHAFIKVSKVEFNQTMTHRTVTKRIRKRHRQKVELVLFELSLWEDYIEISSPVNDPAVIG